MDLELQLDTEKRAQRSCAVGCVAAAIQPIVTYIAIIHYPFLISNSNIIQPAIYNYLRRYTAGLYPTRRYSFAGRP